LKLAYLTTVLKEEVHTGIARIDVYNTYYDVPNLNAGFLVFRKPQTASDLVPFAFHKFKDSGNTVTCLPSSGQRAQTGLHRNPLVWQEKHVQLQGQGPPCLACRGWDGQQRLYPGAKVESSELAVRRLKEIGRYGGLRFGNEVYGAGKCVAD
jgi:hypothetical protein